MVDPPPASPIRTRTRVGSILFWLPAAGFIIATIVLASMDIQIAWEPPLLFPVLNGVVFVGVSAVVAVLSAQAFLRGGSPTLLLLGAGMLAFGIASICGPMFISLGDVDAGVGSHNSLALVSAAIHAVGAIIIWRAVPIERSRFAAFAGTYGLVAVMGISIAVLARADMLPQFMTPDGTTTLRMVVLYSAIVLLVSSAVAFTIRARQTDTPFLHWYAMGLALIGIGLMAVSLGGVATPIGWTGRLSQVVGQFYVLNCLLVSIASMRAPAVEAISNSFQRAEDALRSAQERYRVLFDAVSDAVLVHRLVSPAHDGEVIEFNRAFGELLGYSPAQLKRLKPDLLVEAGRTPLPEESKLASYGTLLFETRLRRRDGTSVPVEVHTRLLDADEGIALSVIRDVSEREAAEVKREMERVRLRQVLDDAAVGFVLVDEDGAVVVMNQEVERLWGRPLPAAKSVEEYWVYDALHHGTEWPVTTQEWPAARVLAGEEYAELLADIRQPDGQVVTVKFSARPVRHAARGIGRVLATAEEVTDDVERDRLVRELDTIRTLVTSTFNAEDIQRKIVSLGARALRCDGALLLHLGRSGWAVTEGFGVLENVKQRPTLPSEQPLLSIAEQTRRAVACPSRECGASALPQELVDSELHSVIMVPLVAQGRIVAAGLFAWRTARPPIATHMDFANRLLGVSAIALDNSETYQRERVIADTLQQVILTTPGSIDGLKWQHLYRPASNEANVGGDFYDVHDLGGDLVTVLVGDVSGKGVQAAKVTSLVRDGVRAYSMLDADPANLLVNLNRLVYRETPPESFVTLFYGVLDLATGELRYGSAGHTSAIIAGPDRAPDMLESIDPICGAFESASFTTRRARLGPEDRLVLYTDGVTEARRGAEQFGELRIAQVVETLLDCRVEEVPAELLATVEAFTNGDVRDDIVIVCLALARSAERSPAVGGSAALTPPTDS